MPYTKHVWVNYAGGAALSETTLNEMEDGILSGVTTAEAASAALAAKAPLASPAFTGTPTAPTGTAGAGGTQIATQAYADTSSAAAVGSRAPLASPAFTGTPTVPTAAVDTATTQAASTAFVVGQAATTTPVVNGTAAVGTSTRYARADHVHPVDTSRAADASVVHLAGAETISGVKTFSSAPVVPTGSAGAGGSNAASQAYADSAVATAIAALRTSLDGGTP